MWRLPHIPGKTAGRHWPSVALCGQPGRWQEWVGAPSFLGEEEEVEGEEKIRVSSSYSHIKTAHGLTQTLVGPQSEWSCWWDHDVAVNGEQSAVCSTMHDHREGGLQEKGGTERNREVEHERLVISGNTVMLNEKDRGGTGTEMHMRDWVSMFLEGNRRQTSLWLHNAQLVTEVGSEQEPTLVTANQSPCQFQERRKKTNLTGHQPKVISLKIFPNNRLSFGLACSTRAGLISNNPSKPLSRFLIAKLLDDLLLIYRHKFPLCLWTWHGLNGLQRTCRMC